MLTVQNVLKIRKNNPNEKEMPQNDNIKICLPCIMDTIIIIILY